MSSFGRNKPQQCSALSSSPNKSLVKTDTRYHWPRIHYKKPHHPADVPGCSSASSTTTTNTSRHHKAKIALLDPAETVVFETKDRNGTAVVVFNACIPKNVHAGEEFYVANSPIVTTSTTTGETTVCSMSCSATSISSSSSTALASMVRVRCPRNCIPGQRVAIVVPKEATAAHKTMEASTVCDGSRSSSVNDNASRQQSSMHAPAVALTVARQQPSQSRQPVPTEIRVHHERDDRNDNDDDTRDDCEHEEFNKSFDHSHDREQDHHVTGQTRITGGHAQQQHQHFQVTVPPSAVPGQILTVLAGGKLVRVRSPNDAVPGSTIRF
jgi:hypothetical protein